MEYVERILVLILYYVGNSLKKKLLAKKKSIEIIYKSDNYIVINKPHDLLINSSNPENKETVEWRLNAQFPLLANPRLKNRFYFIHRLDYAVSGLLVIGLNKKACGAAAVCFQNRTVSKYYLALVRGHIATELLDVQVPVGADKDELSLSNRMCTVSGSGGGAATPGDATKKCLDAKPARTRLLVMERGIFGDGYPATKVLLKLITGRRHQLRVHCKHLGHTIVGDYTYSNRRDTAPQRTFLHSFRLVLDGGVESFDLSTVDPFEASALRGAWTPVEIVNDLDAGAFRQLESPPPLQYTITT